MAYRLRRAGAPRARRTDRSGQEGLDSGGNQSPFDTSGQVVDDRRPPGVLVRRATPARGRVDHYDLPGQQRTCSADPLFGTHRVRLATLDHRGEPGQCLEGGRPAGAVRGDPHVALEVADALLGGVTEQTVDPADLETEVEQPLLEGDHVVTGHQVAHDVREQPVPEPPSGLVENAVRRGPDDPVDGESALLLEVPD